MRRYILPLILLFMWTSAQAQSTSIPLPSKAQLRWQQYERTTFLCLDPCTWQGREYDNHSYPISQINPTRLNTDQWCEVARSWGAKMILFVAKHTGGFCWWQTNTSEYGIKNTPGGMERRRTERTRPIMPQIRAGPGYLRIARRRDLGCRDRKRRQNCRSVQTGSLQSDIQATTDRSTDPIRTDPGSVVRRQLPHSGR